MSHEELWELLVSHQGEPFYTVKGLPFHYTIRGGELFVDRRSKSITRATVQKAYDRILEFPEEITGPKKLNAFGAPYIWAVFRKFGIVGGGRTKSGEDDGGCDFSHMQENVNND
ncbi:MAG: hypothetical protein LUG56_01650 [Lachnospiraceae bacterium]|nr:hypothetical protein [Lachnospiraceae bacterium]